MPDAEALREEERRLRHLRIAVDLAMGVLAQTDLTRAEADRLVRATRALALRLFPGKELAFALIYEPRLRRVIGERFGPS